MKTLSRIGTFTLVSVVVVLSLAASPAKDRVVPAGQLQFKEQQPGIAKAVLWGNPDKGPYGAMTRFTKGTKVPWHTHSHDIKAVVISGTLLYDSGHGEQRLGPGSFLQERSTVKHTTAAAPDSDVVIFEEGSGPFDIKMVK